MSRETRPAAAGDSWLERRTTGAPAALRNRLLHHLDQVALDPSPAEPLAALAQRVLSEVERHPGDRRIALDLLAADALITLALLARAEAAPERLGEFAMGLLTAQHPTA